MSKLNDQAIAEAAYYIWKNNGCPANTHAQDWAAAIEQLSASEKKNQRTAACTAYASKINAVDINTLNRIAAVKKQKISPVSDANKLMALKLASSTQKSLISSNKIPLKKISL